MLAGASWAALKLADWASPVATLAKLKAIQVQTLADVKTLALMRYLILMA
jgi:hypothetical protein